MNPCSNPVARFKYHSVIEIFLGSRTGCLLISIRLPSAFISPDLRAMRFFPYPYPKSFTGHIRATLNDGRVIEARYVEATGENPSPGGRVVQFRAVEKVVDWPPLSSCNQHLAIWQQCRRVTITCGAEAAGGRPGPIRRIIQFRARKIAAAKTTGDQDLAGEGPAELACEG